jgi:hypothetical protein
MTTVAELSLKALRDVTDIMTGAATTGAVTSLTDTLTLTQPPAHWDNGSLWILSGTHAGKVLPVTSYTNNKLTFATLGATAIAAGTRYAVTRAVFPWAQVIASINDALEETYVEATDSTLIGDGETLEYNLPAGVYSILAVHFTDAQGRRSISAHWRETNGHIRWDYGYPPDDGDTIEITYRTPPTEVILYSDVISTDVDVLWLRYKVAEKLLWWAISTYGNVQEFRIEERMNKVLQSLKNRSPRRDAPRIMINTVGA